VTADLRWRTPRRLTFYWWVYKIVFLFCTVYFCRNAIATWGTWDTLAHGAVAVWMAWLVVWGFVHPDERTAQADDSSQDGD